MRAPDDDDVPPSINALPLSELIVMPNSYFSPLLRFDRSLERILHDTNPPDSNRTSKLWDGSERVTGGSSHQSYGKGYFSGGFPTLRYSERTDEFDVGFWNLSNRKENPRRLLFDQDAPRNPMQKRKILMRCLVQKLLSFKPQCADLGDSGTIHLCDVAYLRICHTSEKEEQFPRVLEQCSRTDHVLSHVKCSVNVWEGVALHQMF